ncbi:glycosyltransferase family 1 protein [Parathielavia appendiculata]|uniref:Sterol 3-beta-glucosyltransferase n=1 Tax=Parathielavia appendiculata TaxID=2587402 RepID=A0AAN6Z3N1_9PEZI|nr:glycosyltransferase family 1 protein [Parathielavia appendiculata]
MDTTQPAPPPAPPRHPPHVSAEPTDTGTQHSPMPPSSPPTAPAHASHDDRAVRRVSRKLQKKRRDGEHTPTMELPDRLKDHGDQADNEEEVLRPQGYGGGMFMNMNQSIFGLIAAAGSQADFADRFEGHSSDDEDDSEIPMAKTIAGPKALGRASSPAHSLAHTTVLLRHGPGRLKSELKTELRHRKKMVESRLMRSVPGLARITDKIKHKSAKVKSDAHGQMHEDSAAEAGASAISDFTPSIEITRTESRTAPVMSRMLEARAELAARPSFDLDRLSDEPSQITDAGDSGPSELAKRLKDIFEFDRPEEVIEEYPCWLLQHVLLQGYLYITARHIAFYAYLPKRGNDVIKSGYLSKSGKRNPKYNRYWFRLKGDVLSYYRDPQDLYFHQGHIDLRYAISANITDKDKEGVNFAVVTDQRTYYFRADSPQSANEWVKSLQRVIFRSHNDGDSVKISLPIENVIDIEETNMLDFAETCKIRVIDNDETYAIDEYFFSFFTFGKEAINILKILVEDASSQAQGASGQAEPSSGEQSSKRTSGSFNREQAPNLSIRTGKLSEGVKATLSPMSPKGVSSPSPRPSADLPRTSFDACRPFTRRSMDIQQSAMHYALHSGTPRRSFSGSRRSLSRSRQDGNERQESSDSYVQSMGDPSQASLSALVASASTEDASASQILKGSDVFHSPTIHRAMRAHDGQHPLSPTHAVRHTSTPVSKQPTHSHSAPAQGSIAEAREAEAMPTTPTLQTIATMGGYPIRKANAFIGYLDRHTRHMSNLLATESMGYVEKVSGMWKGGGKHYDEPAGLRTDDEDGEDDPEERANSEARFRAHFALPESERLQATYFGHLMRVLPLYGKIYIGDRHFCFRSLLPGTRTKLILPLRDIENVDKEKGFRFGYAGLVVVIRGHEELFFEFSRAEVRDDCTITMLQSLEATNYLRDSSPVDNPEYEVAQAAVAEHDALQKARNDEFVDHAVQLPHEASSASEAPTILFDDPKASFINFKPAHSMKITCLTIGSRGDVQPYIALCKKLLADGHRPRIATHSEFKPWIESHGIEYAYVGGDPAELMQLCIQNGTFTWAFLKEANAKMRGWLDDLLATAWRACQGSDLLIESPSAMAGIHIAEALGIPYFRAFTMPWTRTRAYPHAFIMPGQKMGGAYNYVTYVMFDNVFWKTTAHQINRWRNNMLSLPNTSLEKMQVNKVPFLYNFSPYVVPPPLDYSDWIRVTGYWFLDEGGDKWTPPAELTEFIERARRDEKKIVYVGFGSILVPDPAKMTQEVIDAVLKADVRCILSKGWSDRLPSKKDKDVGEITVGFEADKKPEPELPPEIFQIQSAPHDWLFRQIDAAAHHGGSGTTGASLRAGIPTIIRPFFGDQFFFGTRVEDLGVGICLKKWGANSFARALWEATNSERMIVKARVLGEQIRKENGVDAAVQCIYRDLEYATSLIKSKTGKYQKGVGATAGTATDGTASMTPGADLLEDDEEEESWTFVGGDAETIDDLSAEGIMKRTLPDLSPGVPGLRARPLGSRVLGGAVETGVGVKIARSG